MFEFASSGKARRASLTPMIDIVFLLLVFFMLAAQFSKDTALPLQLAGQGSDYTGPPRLIEIGPDTILLNGKMTDLSGLLNELTGLTETKADTIVLQPIDQASLQVVIDVMAALSAAGYTGIVIVE